MGCAWCWTRWIGSAGPNSAPSSSAAIRRLTGTKFLWLTTRAHAVTAAPRRAFVALRQSTLKSARAWALKEMMRRLWDFRSLPRARAFFARWYAWAMRSRLAPMRHLAITLRGHLENILTYRTYRTYRTHHITNAVTEGLNAKIQWITYSSRGFRDRERFKLAIYFHCGGLDLEPRI
jgi:transposase